MISYAFAQALTPATPPTDWTALLWIIGIIAAIVVGLVWYEKVYKPAHPTTPTPPIVATVGADVTAAWNSVAAELSKLTTAIHTAPFATPAATIVTTAPAGKNGVPGQFNLSVSVTGVAATDLPAIQAEVNRLYLG